MHIAINTLAHRATGGGITYLRNVLPRLERDDNDYFVLVPHGRGALDDLSSESIHLVPVRFPLQNPVFLVLYEQLLLPLKLLTLDVEIDILFCPSDTGPIYSPVPTVLAVRNLTPFSSAGLHTFDTFGKFKFRIQRLITYLSARAAQKIFFVSDFSRRKCTNYLPLGSNDGSVIHHGIDQEKFSPSPTGDVNDVCDYDIHNKNYILSVSTLNEHKNIEVLFQAFAQLNSDLQDQYDLVIVGRKNSSEYVAELHSIMDEYQIEQSVHLLGEVDYDQIELMYQYATIYLHPSVIESFGHPIAEAMAAGTPIIASDVAAIPEIAGDAAIYFDPNNITELSTAISDLLTNPERRKRLSQQGPRRAEDLSWDHHVEKLTKLLADIE